MQNSTSRLSSRTSPRLCPAPFPDVVFQPAEHARLSRAHDVDGRNDVVLSAPDSPGTYVRETLYPLLRISEHPTWLKGNLS